MAVIYGVVLIAAGGHMPERPRIYKLAATEGGLEYLAVAGAVVRAAAAEAAHRHDTLGTVHCLGGFVGIGSLQIHTVFLSLSLYISDFPVCLIPD
jgi:hypothetical protein